MQMARIGLIMGSCERGTGTSGGKFLDQLGPGFTNFKKSIPTPKF
jgi:hypothetical protein